MRVRLPLLIVLAALLAGALAAAWTMPGDLPAIVRPAPVPSRVAPPALPEGAAWERTVLARPLFSPTRRPPPPEAAGADPAAAAPPRLAGVIIGPDGRRAIFDPAGGKPTVAAEGARIGGFTVTAIEADRVTVAGEGGTRVLRPVFAGAAHPRAADAARSSQ